MEGISANTPEGTPYDDLYIYYLQGHPAPSQIQGAEGLIGDWREEEFSFLFFSRPAGSEVERMISTDPGLNLLDQFHMTYDEWHGGPCGPFQAGSFFIAPPWKTGEEPSGTRRIVLDPGVVFGTGMHPTTADCLGFIETLCGQEKIRTALDVGTGTGLLAIAAAQMGCERVLAVDLNLLAVKTARENIRLNQMENRVLAVQALAEDFTEIPADLIIANIHYDVMKDLIASRHFLCHPEKNRERWVILSGLLRSQAWMVKDCLIKAGVNIMDQKEQGGIWHTFLGRMG